MRLRRQENGSWSVQFTVAWEVAYLAEAGDRWVPFALAHTKEPLGVIHGQTYEVRLLAEVELPARQVVTLLPDGK